MNKVIRWLKRYCVEKGLSHLEITVKRKDKVGADTFEVSVEKKKVNGVVNEGKSKLRVKVLNAGK